MPQRKKACCGATPASACFGFGNQAIDQWRHALGHQIDSVRSLIENVDDGMRGVESRATAEHARIWTALEKPS